MHGAYTATMTSADRSPAALRARLFSQLLPEAVEIVDRILTAAGSQHVYAVGGVVRDLLLGRPIIDTDLVVEGDAIEIVTRALPGMKATTHQRFRTATIAADHTSIDVVTARSETYARPGALPAVRRAGITQDLQRRDFSINAIALRLDGEAELVDPCRGVADLDAGQVRVLHARSFADDATRIFRAFRYSARLRFVIEPETARLLRDRLPFIATISGARMRREVELMLLERDAGHALEAAAGSGALVALHPALSWDGEKSEAYGHATTPVVPRVPFGFALLASGATPEEATGISERLRLRRSEDRAVRAIAAMGGLDATLRRPGAKPSGVVVLLEKYPAAAVAAYSVTASDAIARQLALRYLEEWRHVKSRLRGDDLAALGVPTGPQIERGLQLIRAAKLDGWANDEGDERALALRFVKSIRDSRAARGGITLHPNGH